MARKPAQKPVDGPASSDIAATPQPDPVLAATADLPIGSTEGDPSSGGSTEEAQETPPVDGDAPDARALEAHPASVASMPDSETAAESARTASEAAPEGADVRMDTSARDASSSVAEVSQSDTAAETPPAQSVVVIGPAKGRWRAGCYFTAEPTTIPRDRLSDGDLLALQADPVLHVQIVATPY